MYHQNGVLCVVWGLRCVYPSLIANTTCCPASVRHTMEHTTIKTIININIILLRMLCSLLASCFTHTVKDLKCVSLLYLEILGDQSLKLISLSEEDITVKGQIPILQTKSKIWMELLLIVYVCFYPLICWNNLVILLLTFSFTQLHFQKWRARNQTKHKIKLRIKLFDELYN